MKNLLDCLKLVLISPDGTNCTNQSSDDTHHHWTYKSYTLTLTLKPKH